MVGATGIEPVAPPVWRECFRTLPPASADDAGLLAKYWMALIAQ